MTCDLKSFRVFGKGFWEMHVYFKGQKPVVVVVVVGMAWFSFGFCESVSIFAYMHAVLLESRRKCQIP